MSLAIYHRGVCRADYKDFSMSVWLIQVKYPEGWETISEPPLDHAGRGVEQEWSKIKRSSYGRYRLRLLRDGRPVKYN